VLDQEQPAARSALVSRLWGLLEAKGIAVTATHYNALLRVHLENGHRFEPEEVLADMKAAGATPDKETFQCLISRHCQAGDIEGAGKVLQMMKTAGIKVNENVFNSLILGHGESGDLARAHGMLKVMRTWGLLPSAETFLTLACAYAKAGDWAGVERVLAESAAQGTAFKDGDYLELIYALSEGGHKEHIGKVLALSHPESDNFGSMVSHLVVRLINVGHDDVAYNLVKYTVDNSCDNTGRMVCSEFIDQLVYVSRPVAKLLWFVQDMGEQKILSGGLDRLVEAALAQKNFPLGCKLSEILVSEGGRLEELQFLALLRLAAGSRDEDAVLACVRLGASLNMVTAELLKAQVFPHLESWPELVIASLEEAGLGRGATTTPMVEWLVGCGRTEAAATVAGIFPEHVDPRLKFLTAAARSAGAVCNHFHEPHLPAPQQAPPPSPAPPAAVSVAELNQAGLERLLEGGEAGLEARGQAYIRLLQLHSAAGAMDRAVELSRRLQADEELHLPQFYDLLGILAEQQFSPQYFHQQPYGTVAYQFSPELGQFVPVPVMHSTEDYYPGPLYPAYPPQYTPTPSPAPEAAAPPAPATPPAASPAPEPRPEAVEREVDSASTAPSFPDTCYTEGYEYGYEAAVLHRQLKRAILAGAAGDGLAAYRAMERLGRPVNVTETSSLVEKLIQADLTAEAGEVTRGMLARDTHPLPKIFRFLLNKLATLGSVEEILAIGQVILQLLGCRSPNACLCSSCPPR
jgi:pentatricopeptide repeat protein